MLEEGSITAVVKEEVDFVFMQTFLFAFTMPLICLIYQSNGCYYEVDATFFLFVLPWCQLTAILYEHTFVLTVCKNLQGDDN